MSNSNTESNKYHGTPCKKYGHTLRYKSSGHCVQCQKKRMQEYRATHKEAIRTQDKKWKDANRESCLAYKKKWRATHKEAVQAYGKKYSKNNSAKRVAAAKKWQEKNRDRHNAITKKWRKKNRKRMQEYNRQYSAANPEKNRARAHKRRMNKLNVLTEPYDFASICNHYGNRCLRCNKIHAKLTIDHVIPISKGGDDIASNIQPLCRSCNSKKGVKYIDYRTD